MERSSSLALIGVPSSAGARRTGQDGAPAALRAAGLLERLRAVGLDVTDLGDLPPVAFRPDPEHPRQQNLALVLDVVRQVADRVDRAVAIGRRPLVLGGDCSITLGVIAGLLPHYARLWLLYFDADLDLNTPDTTPSGAFDGMVLAHVLGHGVDDLADIGPRRPLLAEEDVVLFGYDMESGSIDPPERDMLDRSRLARVPLAEVRRDAGAVAREALRGLERRADAILVHFDVDVMDVPAVDVPHPNGLDEASAFAALEVFASAPTTAALAVTELNAARDPDRAYTERLVRGLVASLGPRAEQAA